MRVASLLRWVLVAFAAVYAVILVVVVVGRISWPFEIEWMEGGMLTHAVRLRLGQPIYAAPSADFVPFFYTPLYSMVVAGLARLGLPLGFALGRAVSALSTVATLAMIYAAVSREAGRAWGVFAACLYAAFFRFCGAFYDVVRPDALAMALTLGGALVAHRARTAGAGAAAALLLVAAFFAKQTAAVFAPAIGLALLLRDRRVAVAFAATGTVAGAIALWAVQRASGGWFWFYVFEGHQGHRFLWKNIELEYWRDVLFLAPSLLLVPLLALSRGRWIRLLAVALLVFFGVAYAQRAATLDYPEHMYYRELWYESRRVLVLVPPAAMALLLGAAWFTRSASRFAGRPRTGAPAAPQPSRLPPYWLWLAAAGAFASALNHSTQWAYANCFMPIAVFGSIAVALTVGDFVDEGGAPAILVFAAMVLQLVALAYDPRAQIPSAADAQALATFQRRLAALHGPVLIPSHPFAGFEVNGKVNLHQMGIGDVAFHGGVADLNQRIARGEWSSVVVDENTSIPDLDRTMYVSDRFPYSHDELFPKTGFRVRPLTLWRRQDPVERELAPGMTGNFEGGRYLGWTAGGGAFGDRPALRSELGDLAGLQGRRAASSRGSAGDGTLTSAPFVADAPRVTLLVAGGLGTFVRAMHGDDEIARVQPVDAAAMAPRSLDVARWQGQPIRVEVVDTIRTEAAGEPHPGIVVDDIRTAW